MIKIIVEQASVDTLKEYLERVRQRLLQAMRVGMDEAMHGLAGEAVSAMSGAGIRQHSYKLSTALLESPYVSETSQAIKGTVCGDVGQLHVGLWMDYGTHQPAVEGKLMRFAPAGGETIYRRGHVAFDVEPHPFMNPALQAFKAPIMELIQARVNEALQG